MNKMRTFTYAFAGAVLAVLGGSVSAFASEGAAAASGYGAAQGYGAIAIAAGIAIAGAAFGCGLGQGRAVAAAMESIGRNPNSADRIQTPMIIGLAMIEALAIYALVIAFFLQGKIPG